jgi:AraC-like DNA-binding protein
LEQKNDAAHILMENRVATGKPTRQFSEFVQGSAFRIFLSQFADAHDKLRVCFRHGAPEDGHQHQKFFGHTPVFDHDFNGFICPVSLLDQRNPGADSEFSLYTRNLVEAKAIATAPRRADDVLRVVMQLLPSGRCDAEHIAECLGVDRRTVHRQLLREGKTISSLIEEVRIELSTRYVLESTLPISDLAPMLGFHSTSALVNWYRRRYGMPPTHHRRAHAGTSGTV